MLRVWSVIPNADRTGENRGRFLPLKLMAEEGIASTALLTNETPQNRELNSLWNGLVPFLKTPAGPFSWWGRAMISLRLLSPNLPADILLMRPWSNWTKAVILAKKLYGRPYAVWLDTYNYKRQEKLKDFLYHEIRYGLLLRNASLVIGETPDVTRNAAERLPNVRTIHIPVGLDMKPLRAMEERWSREENPPRREKTILYVGRISPEKRPHWLVESFGRLAAEFPDWRLKLIGPVTSDGGTADEVYLQQFRQAIEQSGVKERIEHIPGLYGEALFREYAKSSIYALPSTIEGVPTTVMEAMYFGGAVLVTESGVVAWQLDNGGAGIVIDQRDHDAFTDALRSLVARPEERERLMAAARQRVLELFSWEKNIRTLVQELEQTVSPERRGVREAKSPL